MNEYKAYVFGYFNPDTENEETVSIISKNHETAYRKLMEWVYETWGTYNAYKTIRDSLICRSEVFRVDTILTL